MIRRHESDRRPQISVPGVWVTLAGILTVAAFLRFWGIGTNFHFMGDEGTQSMAEWGLIHGNLPLLGPSLSIGTMHPHLGPIFYYLAAGPLWLSGGSPIAPTVMVGISGIAAVAVLFLYLRFPLGDWPALGASAVMATSFLMVEYSRRPWNPTPTPFFALLFLWSLVLWKRHSSRYMVLTAGTLAVLLQLQPVNIFLVALLGVFVVLARPPVPSLWFLCLAAGLFLAVSSPLIAYDLTHGFANTENWLSAFLGARKGTGGPHTSSPRVLLVLFNRAFEPRIVAVSIVIAVTICLAAIYVALADNDAVGANWELLSPLMLLVIAAVGFEVYRHEVFEQYMVCLFPLPFIFLAALLRLLWKGPLARGLAVVVVISLSAVGVRDVVQYCYLTPEVTVASAAVISHDLEPDDTYGHVVAVGRVIEGWAAGRAFSVRMESPINSPQGYEYVLARQHDRPGRGELTFLLVEPPSFPRRLWTNAQDRALVRGSDRTATIGVVRLYEIP